MGKILIVMVGLPRAGKSTSARGISRVCNAPLINPDSFRKKLHGQDFYLPAENFVWACVRLAVDALFEAGHDYVIIDATHITRKFRDSWKSDVWQTRFVVIDTPMEECLKRAGSNLALCTVIRDMAAKYEPLGKDEIEFSLRASPPEGHDLPASFRRATE